MNLDDSAPDDDLLPDYDFSDSAQGQHYREYHESTRVVTLKPELSEEPTA